MKRSIVELLALQETDLRLRELEKKYKTIPAERAELVAEFEVVRSALAKAEGVVKQLELQIRQCETEIATKKAHLQEIRVRSGTVKKVTDYNAVMSEITTTENAISELEEQELIAMDSLDQAKEKRVKAERNYRATGRIIQKEVRELDALKEAILENVRELAVQSKEQEKRIAQTTLDIYKRLLAAGKGSPVGKISAGLCSNCNLQGPPMTLNEAKKGQLVHCDNCSCFLYDPEGSD